MSLANSESIPAGAHMEFEVECLDPKHESAVLEWLGYGERRGLGQWRNSGCGRFKYEKIEAEDDTENTGSAKKSKKSS